MSDKTYNATEEQILKCIKTALEIRIQDKLVLDCIMDDIEGLLDYYEEDLGGDE